jgi:hypothetical protein
MPFLNTILFFLKKHPSIRFVLFTVFFFFQGPLVAQPAKEYQVKAVFLFNFTQFVDWPVDSFNEATSPFIICIFGEDPFGPYLEKIIAGEKVEEHTIIIKRVSKIEDAKGCHILFINASGVNRLKEILTSVEGQPILTVSDANNFAKNGGVIRMYTEDKKIKIRINLTAAKASELTISSKLLGIADIVE